MNVYQRNNALSIELQQISSPAKFNYCLLRKMANGFTFIELLVAIVVVTILTTIGIPSFNEQLTRYRMKTEVDKWHLALNMARQAAITNNHIVTMCPSNNGLSCSSIWQDGAIIFVDINKDHQRQSNEQLIEVVEKSKPKQLISWRAFQNRNYIQNQRIYLGAKWHVSFLRR